MIHSHNLHQLFILKLKGHSEMIHSRYLHHFFILRLKGHSEMIHSHNLHQFFILRLKGHSEVVHSPNLHNFFILRLKEHSEMIRSPNLHQFLFSDSTLTHSQPNIFSSWVIASLPSCNLTYGFTQSFFKVWSYSIHEQPPVQVSCHCWNPASSWSECCKQVPSLHKMHISDDQFLTVNAFFPQEPLGPSLPIIIACHFVTLVQCTSTW